MKIAIIASGFLPVIDGVTVSGFYRLQKLSQKGHEVIFFCPDYSKIANIYPNWQDYRGEIFPGIKVINLKSSSFFVEFERNVRWDSYGKLITELENFQPDIIHVDEPERLFVGFWKIAGLKFAKKYNIPCISFFRTNFIEYLEDFLPLPLPLIATVQWIVKKLIIYVYNSYDLTLVTSPITQKKIQQFGIKNTFYKNLVGFEPDKYKTAIREKDFFAKKYNASELDNKIKIVFVGRLTPDKGWNFTLNSLPKLFQEIDKDKVAFLVVGDGEMKEKIEQSFLKNKAHFKLFGRVAPEDIPSLLVNSDLHVTTSEKETRGLTILEAFAASIPVLAPNSGGVVENIESGINGFLYNPGDEPDFIGKFKLLVEDFKLRDRMGREGQQSIEGKYSWEKTVDNLLEIWRSRIDLNKE